MLLAYIKLCQSVNYFLGIDMLIRNRLFSFSIVMLNFLYRIKIRNSTKMYLRMFVLRNLQLSSPVEIKLEIQQKCTYMYFSSAISDFLLPGPRLCICFENVYAS